MHEYNLYPIDDDSRIRWFKVNMPILSKIVDELENRESEIYEIGYDDLFTELVMQYGIEVFDGHDDSELGYSDEFPMATVSCEMFECISNRHGWCNKGYIHVHNSSYDEDRDALCTSYKKMKYVTVKVGFNICH